LHSPNSFYFIAKDHKEMSLAMQGKKVSELNINFGT